MIYKQISEAMRMMKLIILQRLVLDEKQTRNYHSQADFDCFSSTYIFAFLHIAAVFHMLRLMVPY